MFMLNSQNVKGIAIMGSWNTDGGVSRHTTPIVEYLRSQGYKVRVFTHYKESPHGMPLDVKDEDFVTRCYTSRGEQILGLKSFDPLPLLDAIEQEGYNIFMAEDLGMLPTKELLEILPRIRRKAKMVLLNHDNKPRPDDSLFWKFNWDAVINFLPQQNEFMLKHYPPEKIYLTDFPCYPVLDVDRDKACKTLDLPMDKKIILTFGEYDFVAPFKALYELRNEDPSIYLIALVYTKDMKNSLQKNLKERGFDKGYDEIRVERSSWQRRAEYMSAAQLLVLDKGEGVRGNGAVLSSTAFQAIGWGAPIIARDNFFFKPFDDAVVRYSDNEELYRRAKQLLSGFQIRKNVLDRARAFAYAHSPERVSTQILHVFKRLLNPIQYPPCGKLTRFKGNPILKARTDAAINVNGKKVHWEKLVYNAAAVRMKGTTYVLYRALGEDGISRIGLWWSKDGYHQDGRLPFPIFGPKEAYELPTTFKKRQEDHMKRYGMVREIGGTEDPRITLIDNTLYMTYSAYGDKVQLAMAKIDVADFLKATKECTYQKWNNLWQRNGPVFKALDDKDAVLFPVRESESQRQMASVRSREEFVTLFPELWEGKFALIHRVPPDMQVFYTENFRNQSTGIGETFFIARPGMWDGEKVGAGAPPLKTKYGWLHVYHGVGTQKGKKAYRLGVLLTSIEEPSKIIYVSPEPIIEPEEDYEVNGWVPNVVFTCGVVPKHRDSDEILNKDDEIMVYYGAADEVIGVAETKIGDLIPEIIRNRG